MNNLLARLTPVQRRILGIGVPVVVGLVLILRARAGGDPEPVDPNAPGDGTARGPVGMTPGTLLPAIGADSAANVAAIAEYQSATTSHLLGLAERIDSLTSSGVTRPPTADEQWLQSVYQGVLGRDADINGLAYWTSRLGAGTSRQDVLNAIYNSAEARARRG